MTSVAVTTFDVGVTTLTDVDAISHIAQDIKDMAANLENGDFLEARRIYEFGKWSPQYDKFGNEMDDLLSLKHMSGAGSEGMFKEDPSYMFQVLGLADLGLSIEDTIARHGNYADVYITEQLNDYTSGTLGAQASTILIVSMYAAHQLWDGLMNCFAATDGFGGGVDKAKQAFDNFIALYIGYGQTLAPDWGGDMLYELAQAGADLFDTADVEGEAIVNSDIKEIYQSMQRVMSEENACSRDDHLERLWVMVNKIIVNMYIPMVQMLIHSMKQDDEAHKVRMYALAVIPQLSQCRPSVREKLKDYLLDKPYDKKDFSRILALLQESYDCLGIWCEDVGAYSHDGDVVAECAGFEDEHPLAGFVPKQDVRVLAKADLDIFAIDQLLRFPSSTKNQHAQFYYKFGKAASIEDYDLGMEALSPWNMIDTLKEKNWSPYANDYVEYYMDGNYEDLMLENVFDGNVEPENTPEQRRAMIVSLLRYNVVPEYMMHLLGLSLEICNDGSNTESPTQYWDAFAAMYIGSLEGIKAGGSDDDDGLFLWSVANNRARQFNTQSAARMAKVNSEMTNLLFAGQSELEKRDCINFEKTSSRVLHLMMVPLIQSVIWYAIQNEGAFPDEASVAIGEALALSILPIVSKYDNQAAAVIERNMLRVFGVAPVKEGPQAVANALFRILDDIGWDCEYVGQAQGVDTCEQFDPNAVTVKSAGSALSMQAFVAIFVGFTSAMCILAS